MKTLIGICIETPRSSILSSLITGSKFYTSGLGPVGVAISGAFLFNHLSNPSGADDVAAVQEDTSFDTCMGHSAPGCIYHYHRVTADCQSNLAWYLLVVVVFVVVEALRLLYLLLL